jgi:hypothetical protein
MNNKKRIGKKKNIRTREGRLRKFWRVLEINTEETS